jgi:hypothetical protein
MMANPFEDLLASLARAEVRYVTVGGLACALNGFVRATEDVDILIQRTPENVRRLLDVLVCFGEGYARELSPDEFVDEEGAIRVVEDFAVDIFTRMAGRTYEDLAAHFRTHQVAGVSIPYLAAEGLILLKGNSLREKDRIDVLALRQILDEREPSGGAGGT